MDLATIEDIIVGYLAEDAGYAVDEYRAQLLAGGIEMPIDSVLAVAVLVRVQTATGVQLPATAETALAMRSVRTFALAIAAQLNAGHVRPESA